MLKICNIIRLEWYVPKLLYYFELKVEHVKITTSRLRLGTKIGWR